MTQSNLIAKIEAAGDFVMLEDGFIYYSPSAGGGLASHHLREIADELDRRNEPWARQVDSMHAETIAIAPQLVNVTTLHGSES